MEHNEGGPICQLTDKPQIQKYFPVNLGGDGSYQLANGAADAEKVIYCNKDFYGNISTIEHSAVKSTDPLHGGKYISKWGMEGPLVLHDLLDLPNDYKGTDIMYFKKSSDLIFGYYRVCDGGNSFTFNCSGSGNVTWTLPVSGAFSFDKSSQVTTKTTSPVTSPPATATYNHQITVYRRSGTGNGTLKATNVNNNNITHTINIESCTPSFSIEGNHQDPICTTIGRNFILKEVINNFNNDYSCSASWEINGTGFVLANSYTGNHHVSVKATSAGGQQATLIAKDAIGNILATKSIIACSPPPPPPAIYPSNLGCIVSQTFTLTNIPPLSYVSWSLLAPGGEFVLLNYPGNSVTVAINSWAYFGSYATLTASYQGVTYSVSLNACEDVYFFTGIVNSNTTITKSAPVFLQNLTVTNNAKLTIQAPSVYIEGEIDVQQGSEFEIQH